MAERAGTIAAYPRVFVSARQAYYMARQRQGMVGWYVKQPEKGRMNGNGIYVEYVDVVK